MRSAAGAFEVLEAMTSALPRRWFGVTHRFDRVRVPRRPGLTRSSSSRLDADALAYLGIASRQMKSCLISRSNVWSEPRPGGTFVFEKAGLVAAGLSCNYFACRPCSKIEL